jgi:hypothetical protein
MSVAKSFFESDGASARSICKKTNAASKSKLAFLIKKPFPDDINSSRIALPEQKLVSVF